MTSSLFLLPNVLSGRTDVQANLRALGAKWRRTIGLQWGPLVGTFRIEGEESVLAGYMNNWLGMHVEERLGRETWTGIVVDLTLRSRVVRRRSLENVWNKVRVKYGNLVENGSFETLDPGSNVFLYWEQTGTVGTESDDIVSGALSAQLGIGESTIYQDILAARERNTYRLSFYYQGDDANEPLYSVASLSPGGDIIPETATKYNEVGSGYKRETVDFSMGNSHTGGLRVTLKTGIGASALFEDVEIRRLEEGQVVESYTDHAVSQESINAFGTREYTSDGKELGPTESERARDNFLNRHAWPRLERLSQRGQGNTAVLEGVAIGYGLTTSWVYTQNLMAMSNVDASTLMGILLAESEYIANTTIKTNAELVRLSDREQRLLESIEAVVAASGNGDYWHIYIGRGRRAIFKPINFTPKYYLQDGELRSSLNGPVVDPHLVVPGIVRDVSYPRGVDYPNSPYQDRRDFLMEEVMVEDGKLDWKIGDFLE